MTAYRIQEAAFARFAAQGFDATTLAEIAGDVGIKKPSIYAHFSGKQALFLNLATLAVEREMHFACRQLLVSESVGTVLRDYLTSTVERYSTLPHVRFWFRAAHVPPAILREEISALSEGYTDCIRTAVLQCLCAKETEPHNSPLPLHTLVTAYMGILRGLQAELLHSTLNYPAVNDYPAVLDALWRVYACALSGLSAETPDRKIQE